MSPDAAPDPAAGPAGELAEAEAALRSYLDLWNRGDVETIWARCYAKDAVLPWDRARMTAARALLETQEFAGSQIEALVPQHLGAGHVSIRLRFTRVTKAGAALGTHESLYVYRRQPDGWRITEMHPVR